MPKSWSLRASMPIRMGAPAMVSGALQAEVRAQERRPGGVMLGVERAVAVAVGTRRGCRCRPPGAAAQMGDDDVGREQDAPAAGTQRGAEVDVLQIHEVALVEEADRFGVGSFH